jgi:hypothetical protein
LVDAADGDMASGRLEGMDLQAQVAQILTFVAGRV